MKIAIETVVKATITRVWGCWNNPEDIRQWNAASDDWHTTRSTVDLREGGKFLSRMEAKDGSVGFDLEGTYIRIVPQKLIEYRLSDVGRPWLSSSSARTASLDTAHRPAGYPRQLRAICGSQVGVRR